MPLILEDAVDSAFEEVIDVRTDELGKKWCLKFISTANVWECMNIVLSAI